MIEVRPDRLEVDVDVVLGRKYIPLALLREKCPRRRTDAGR